MLSETKFTFAVTLRTSTAHRPALAYGRPFVAHM